MKSDCCISSIVHEVAPYYVEIDWNLKIHIVNSRETLEKIGTHKGVSLKSQYKRKNRIQKKVWFIQKKTEKEEQRNKQMPKWET